MNRSLSCPVERTLGSLVARPLRSRPLISPILGPVSLQ